MQEFNRHTCEAVLRTCKTCFVYTTALAMQPVFISELLRGKISSHNSPKILRHVINYILYQIFHPTNLFSPPNTGILDKNLLNPANQIKSIKICHRYYHIGGLLVSDLN